MAEISNYWSAKIRSVKRAIAEVNRGRTPGNGTMVPAERSRQR